MSKLTKLEFTPLSVSGDNYISWARDVKLHLASMGLEDTISPDKRPSSHDKTVHITSMGLEETISPEKKPSSQDKAKAMIFLCHHIDEALKLQYVTLESPLELWQKLKERYDHLKMIILPKARSEWHNLRLQDFKSVREYNSAMFKITSKLQLCGEKISEEDMLEKTFSTFHASNMILQQQYRERNFRKYSELITCMLLAEQNNELLMRNHESRPTGAAPFPETNLNQAESHMRDRGHPRNQNNRGRYKNRGRGRRNAYKPQPRFDQNQQNERRPNKAQQRFNPRPRNDEPCDRCGIKGHWARVCRTATHLAELYQASKRRENTNAEANMATRDDTFDNILNDDITHLDADDFIEPTGTNE